MQYTRPDCYRLEMEHDGQIYPMNEILPDVAATFISPQLVIRPLSPSLPTRPGVQLPGVSHLERSRERETTPTTVFYSQHNLLG